MDGGLPKPAHPGLFDPLADTVRRQGAGLPHWAQGGVTYFVTFRLADSLPQALLDAWQTSIDAQTLHAAARRTQRQCITAERVMRALDEGQGDCLLAVPTCAGLVAQALNHFDGQRYCLWAWCVMPNHVHALVEPGPQWPLSAITHSWKSYSAHHINKHLGRVGRVWQPESFDHIVRTGAAFESFRTYILANPSRAGLHGWPHVGAKPLPVSS